MRFVKPVEKMQSFTAKDAKDAKEDNSFNAKGATDAKVTPGK